MVNDTLERYLSGDMRQIIEDWGDDIVVDGQPTRGIIEWGWDNDHDIYRPFLFLASEDNPNVAHGQAVSADVPDGVGGFESKTYWIAGIRAARDKSTVCALQESDLS